jgi:hypothetical protein
MELLYEMDFHPAGANSGYEKLKLEQFERKYMIKIK